MILQINNLRSKAIAVCLIPLLWLLIDIAFDNLGANPVQALHIRLGDWSLRFLCLTLAVTPIQIITKWRGLSDYRQILGLYAFFYGTLHVLAYLLIDHGLIWQMISIDIIESPYIWIGLLAYIIVLLLALTSSKWAKKLMGKNWKKLHRLIYIAAIAAVMHYFWQLKGNLAEPFFYSIIAFFLLGFRILVWVKNRQLNNIKILDDRQTITLAEEQGEIPETIHNSTKR
jgi:sulfoxide reductase heme-binding subunit YedZ